MQRGLRILSWNILHGGGPTRVPEIALAILARSPDVVVLTEFRASRGGQLRATLADAGLEHQLTSTVPEGRNAVMVASRFPLRRVDDGPEVDPGRFLHALLEGPDGPIGLVGVHIPDQVEGGRKARFWRHLISRAPDWAKGACVVLGDLNTARRGIDTHRNDFGVTCCADLMGVFASHGFKDAWLAAHPRQLEATWSLPRGLLPPDSGSKASSGLAARGAGLGSRIDAAYLSATLSGRVAAVRHDHLPREKGVSDHSMLILDLNPLAVEARSTGAEGPESVEISPKMVVEPK